MSTVIDPTVTPTAPETEAPVAPPATAPSEPAKPQDRREVIADAFRNPTQRGKHAASQPREQGRFAGPPAPQFPTPQAIQRPEMPKSLKKEVEAHWNTAPVELVSEFHRREQDYEKGLQPLRMKAQEADELLNEFKPYEMLLKMEGATPRQAIGSLLQTAAILRTGTPAQKAQA